MSMSRPVSLKKPCLMPNSMKLEFQKPRWATATLSVSALATDANNAAFSTIEDARARRMPASPFVPSRQRHHDRRGGRQFRREHLLVAGLGPLPDADGRPQVLTGILRIAGPVEIRELNPAAVHQRAFGHV